MNKMCVSVCVCMCVGVCVFGEGAVTEEVYKDTRVETRIFFP